MSEDETPTPPPEGEAVPESPPEGEAMPETPGASSLDSGQTSTPSRQSAGTRRSTHKSTDFAPRPGFRSPANKRSKRSKKKRRK